MLFGQEKAPAIPDFVWIGDSITQGPTDPSISVIMATATPTIRFGPQWRHHNTAISGEPTGQMVQDYASTVRPYSLLQGRRAVSILGGANDGAFTPAQTYANIATLCSNARTDGFKVILNSPTRNTGDQSRQSAIRDLIMADLSICDFFIDMWTLAPNATDPAVYMDGAGTHLTVPARKTIWAPPLDACFARI